MRRNKYNVIIDTNIIVSALAISNNNLPVVRIIELFYNNMITVYYSDGIIDEYKRVLYRKNPCNVL